MLWLHQKLTGGGVAERRGACLGNVVGVFKVRVCVRKECVLLQG